MTLWFTILLAVLISLFAIAFVVWPLFNPKQRPSLVENQEVIDLVHRKDIILQSIKEIEFDYHTQKLSEPDFQRLNARLRQQALALMRRIEKAEPDFQHLEAELEAAISEKRQQYRPERMEATPKNYCPQCGSSVAKDDNFCASCGKQLKS